MLFTSRCWFVFPSSLLCFVVTSFDYFPDLSASFFPVQWGKNDTDWAINAQNAIDTGADALLALVNAALLP